MKLSYEDYMVSLLRPLGAYDLGSGTINRGELAAYGRELDLADRELEDTAREMNLTTAKDFGLERVEALLPYRPVCVTEDQRRAALAALLRISGDSFTPQAINDTLLRPQRQGGGGGAAGLCEDLLPRRGRHTRGL